ncbi:MAG: response regulator [Microscillaceae bacterium]|jgi:two-component system cell cycle response regulator DivK|nr:response regulator [Microscillaceae bacterium]
MASILYVEDDPINALIIKKLLQKTYHIEIAQDSSSCLDWLKKYKFDLILMDVNLGEEKMDGISIMQKIRQTPHYQSVKVLAVTAFALPEDRERFMQLGFDEYVSKPIEKDSLLNLIAKQLGIK